DILRRERIGIPFDCRLGPPLVPLWARRNVGGAGCQPNGHLELTRLAMDANKRLTILRVVSVLNAEQAQLRAGHRKPNRAASRDHRGPEGRGRDTMPAFAADMHCALVSRCEILRGAFLFQRAVASSSLLAGAHRLALALGHFIRYIGSRSLDPH